jgi:hypothetical protein
MAKEKDRDGCLSKPAYSVLFEEDVWVTMRDGVRLAVDVYRPKAEGRFPGIMSFSPYGKESQKLPTGPEYQPSDYIRGTGGHECGEQGYFVSRGYVQVIPDIRGIGKSGGKFTADWGEDGYDLIEWIGKQPWCNGSVGMVGVSAFAISQYLIAAKKPPHLKAIFPFESLTDRYRHSNFHGGIFNYHFPLHLSNLMPIRGKQQPVSLTEFTEEELGRKLKDLLGNPDIQCTPYLYLIATCPEMNPAVFDLMLHPFDGPYYQRLSPCTRFKDIEIPAFLGSRWNGWALHLPGAFDAYENLATPRENKKLMIIPSNHYGGMDRPFHEVQDIILRWYDYWLKGIDTGIMGEPRILIFVQGINKWRYETEWPIPVTEWTKFFLREGGRLSTTPPGEKDKPQIFTSDPWANPDQGFGRSDVLAKADPVPKVVYETERLVRNTEVTGPIALYWYASIQSEGLPYRGWKSSEAETLESPINDTDWYLKLLDIDVDGSERCVAEGWLKASHYELDESKSRPYAPYHPHTRSLPIKPGEMIRYASDLRMTSNVFLAGHKIRLEIAAQDQVQAVSYHLPHMAKVKHYVYSNGDCPSFLLLPIIPSGYEGAGEPAQLPEGPFRMPKYNRNG